MVDKSKLKVWEIPFTSTVSGTILALAESQEQAIEYMNKKLENGSLGWDTDNLAEEGILHDGSIQFLKIEVSEPESPEGIDIKQNSMEPSEHPDWDVFEDDEAEIEAKLEG